MRLRLSAFGLAAGLALTGAAQAQVDVTGPNGERVHVGQGSGVTVTQPDGRRAVVRPGAGPASARPRADAECTDGRIEVPGANQVLHVSGVCSSVELSGTRNTVYATLAPGAAVALSGTQNRLIWSPADPRGAPPRFDSNGVANSYSRAR